MKTEIKTTKRSNKIETDTKVIDWLYNYFIKAPTPENFAMLLANMKEYQEDWIIDRMDV